MEIGYSDSKTQKLCEDKKIAYKKLGMPLANRLFQRLEWLKAADTLATFNQKYNSLKIHLLRGDYEGCYALNLDGMNRLIFYPCNDEGEFVEEAEFENITVITVEEVSKHYGD